ncbi:MAG: hypothetical protein HOH00_04660 [Candidatus Pelagibacter sp.]|jgi:hypothetical protein|nr:hypothetical protein [Candidatus Pelagibacter sp.]
MLTSCGVYSKKISDWTGFDLIIFLVITLIIGFFWYLIMATVNDENKKDNNKK